MNLRYSKMSLSGEEIQVQSRLKHCNILSLLWAAETPSELLLLMPFASGGDLHAAVGNRTISEAAAARLCEQLLSGRKLRASYINIYKRLAAMLA